MSDYSIKGYDAWKLMSPDEEQDTRQIVGDCDCCDRTRIPLYRTWGHGIETYACVYCLEGDEER